VHAFSDENKAEENNWSWFKLQQPWVINGRHAAANP
jgi:hypothetical protein